ncbi:hypothetical protein H4N54_10760, partial [Limnospira fusiformis KN01]
SLDYRNRRNLQPVKLQDGYDFRQGVTQFDESHFDFDLDGDGDQDDEDVRPNDLTLEAVRRLNGFYDNNFITTQNVWNNAANSISLWIDGVINRSSYVNNYVTPIQTRAAGIEYVMEICREPLVSMCYPDDWVVNIPGQTHFPEYASELSKWPTLSRSINNDATGNYPPAGTTAERVKLPRDRIYPRRIAFLRNYQSDHKLFHDSNGNPVPLAVNGNEVRPAPFGENINIPLDEDGNFSPAGTGTPYSFSAIAAKTNEPRPLVFQMNGSYPMFHWPADGFSEMIEEEEDSDNNFLYAQPLWEPVVQLNTILHDQQNLLPQAVATTFNLIIASGDSPIRQTNGNETELNGGLHNFTRFLEMWQGRTVNISGSFMQFKHSAYATGPMMSVLNQNSPHLTKFGRPLTSGNRPYRSWVDQGQTPFYGAPNRNYGYDVGRMIFPPDLFGSRLVTPSTEPTDKYFREVSRDDPWIHTLLCGKTDNGLFLPNDPPNKLRDKLGLPDDQCPLDPDRFFKRRT